MNIRYILISVVLVVVFNALFVFFGGLDLLVATKQQAETSQQINADIVDVFRFTLEDEVRKKIGAPIEGYEPFMFIKVFPGLVETDFDGVQASIGYYTMEEGKLQYKLDDSRLVHSAAKAITRQGYATLFENIASRVGIDLSQDGTITDIMSSITS